MMATWGVVTGVFVSVGGVSGIGGIVIIVGDIGIGNVVVGGWTIVNVDGRCVDGAVVVIVVVVAVVVIVAISVVVVVVVVVEFGDVCSSAVDGVNGRSADKLLISADVATFRTNHAYNGVHCLSLAKCSLHMVIPKSLSFKWERDMEPLKVICKILLKTAKLMRVLFSLPVEYCGVQLSELEEGLVGKPRRLEISVETARVRNVARRQRLYAR